MKKRLGISFFRYVFGIAVLCLLMISWGCSNTKYLQQGQQLYLGANVKIKNSGKVQDKQKLAANLEDMINPKPNKAILGFLRPQLWFYNIAGTPKKNKGLRHFIKYKLGQPPVLFQDVDPDFNAKLLQNYLENNGYFQPMIAYDIVTKGDKKVKLRYTVEINSAYRYNKIDFPPGDSGIAPEIRQTKAESILKPGDPYSLDQLKEERARIETALKDKGYFYFRGDDLIFKVDSTVGSRQVDVYLRVKPDLPQQATKKYRLDNIYIYSNYSIRKDTIRQKNADTLSLDGYQFIGLHRTLRPRVIQRSLFLKPHELYQSTAYDLTLNQLMNLGVFKFVNIRFEETDSNGKSGFLNTYIYLTPMPRKMLRTELRAVTQSNNFAGPQADISFRNRNFLRGAELFTTTLNGSFETLISNTTKGLNTYEGGINVSLDVPRFIVPFKVGKVSSRYVPKTRMSLGYNLTNRVEYFLINDFNARFGYRWQEDVKRLHELYPVAINYYQLSHTTDKFRNLIEGDEILQRSFANQFVLGLSYTYTYNGLAEQSKRLQNQFYFTGNIDESGNLAYLAQRTVKGIKPSVDTPFTIFGATYAQYSRFSADFRYYINLTKTKKLVLRFAPGVGIPYGNSSSLPYAKLFFEGGNNSVRAFGPRTLGPGSYDIRKQSFKTFFIGEGGDMKLEANSEYRFNYTGIFNGAFFMDAGNTWLVRPVADRPGGLFRFKDFYKEVALGAGTGLRIDASFFVLRFDVAYPLRKPYLPEGQRWINPGQPEWKLNSIVFNLAIGYPF